MEKVYIVWDNSNIHYGGLDHVFPIKEPDQPRELYRTHFLNLLNLVVAGRTIGDIYFVGSTPPDTDSIWNYLGQHRRTLKRKGPAGRFHPAGQIYAIPSALQPH